jgi:hypothetical protein
MDLKVSSTELYELVREHTDKETAHKVVMALQQTIQEEVAHEAELQIKDLKVDIIDRISSAKIQTILWVVGVGVLQLLARYFFE